MESEVEKLKKCQSNLKIDSCLKCKEILKCEIREEYVAAVYKSMNPSESGGFEF